MKLEILYDGKGDAVVYTNDGKIIFLKVECSHYDLPDGLIDLLETELQPKGEG